MKKKLTVINVVLLFVLVILMIYSAMKWSQRNKSMMSESFTAAEEKCEWQNTSSITEEKNPDHDVEITESSAEKNTAETMGVSGTSPQPTTIETMGQKTETQEWIRPSEEIPHDTGTEEEGEEQKASENGEWGMGDGFQ